MAKDTQVGIISKERVGIIHRELCHLSRKGGFLYAVFHTVILQLTSTVLGTGEAVCLVVG